MLRTRTLLFALTALSTALVAEDFGPVVKAAGLIFPGRTHYGVVCNYDHSRALVADLLHALPEGSTLTVVDAHNPAQIGAAGSVIASRGVQMLALLPSDPLVRDGSPYATGLVHRFNRTAANFGNTPQKEWAGSIPAFGTTPAALQNGCALAMGKATGWELMLNPDLVDPGLKGIIGPIEITQTPSVARMNPLNLPGATLYVVSLAR